MDDPILSMKEVVAYLGNVISRASVYREMTDGKLVFIRIRSRRFVRKSDLDRYLNDRTKAA